MTALPHVGKAALHALACIDDDDAVFLLKAGIKRLVLRKLRLHVGHKRSRDIVDLRGDGDGVRHADALEPPDGLVLRDLQLVRRADHRQLLLEGDDLIADLKAHVQHLLCEAENAPRAAFDLHAGDECPLAGTADEEALLLQLLERHAHGRAADAEGVLQLLFGRQDRTGRIVAALDPFQ